MVGIGAPGPRQTLRRAEVGEEVGLAVAELRGLPVDEPLAVRAWRELGNAVINERPNGDGSTGRVRGSRERMMGEPAVGRGW